MAAREDESQAIVLDGLALPRRHGIDERIDVLAGTPRVGPRAPPDRVDGLETSRGHEPRSGIGRHAVARPLLERGPERVVQRLLGAIEVAEQADQRGQDAARLGAVDRVHELAYVLSRIPVHSRRSRSHPRG